MGTIQGVLRGLVGLLSSIHLADAVAHVNYDLCLTCGKHASEGISETDAGLRAPASRPQEFRASEQKTRTSSAHCGKERAKIPRKGRYPHGALTSEPVDKAPHNVRSKPNEAGPNQNLLDPVKLYT